MKLFEAAVEITQYATVVVLADNCEQVRIVVCDNLGEIIDHHCEDPDVYVQPKELHKPDPDWANCVPFTAFGVACDETVLEIYNRVTEEQREKELEAMRRAAMKPLF